MRKSALLLSIFLLITSTFASDLDDDKTIDLNDSNKAQTWLTKIIENLLRKQVIPALENLHIENLNLGEKIGSFSNVTVLHANEANLLPITGHGNNIDNLTLILDQLNVTGHYDLVSLQLPGPIFLNGHGNFVIGLQNFTFSTGVSISAPGSLIVVNGFPNFYLYLNHSYLNFEHLMGNDFVGDLLNSIISDALPSLVQAAYREIIEALTPVIAPVLSSIFTCFKNHLLNPSVCFENQNFDIEFEELLSLLYNIH